ncbi:MAG: hypothetical protein IJX74_00070 [Clostridia bacterium]|nr:hypothetical protein [Clostridia bacterium]
MGNVLFNCLSATLQTPLALYIDPSSFAVFGTIALLLLGALALGITVLCLVITAKMAKKRGENVVLWVILAVFIGWIAAIILAVIGKKPTDTQNDKTETTDKTE